MSFIAHPSIAVVSPFTFDNEIECMINEAFIGKRRIDTTPIELPFFVSNTYLPVVSHGSPSVMIPALSQPAATFPIISGIKAISI